MAKIVTIDGIPVYDAIITDATQGMDKISLVDAPAVMSDFLKFKEETKQVLFAVADEDKHLVYGVIMRADFPIYRRDDQMGEFYIKYKADTIREMAEKYLADGKCNNVNLMHQDGSDVSGVQMVQYFIKDTAMGVCPAGFENIADGSLFGEFHITNDEVWASVKEGTYKGFSLEGIFDFVPETNESEVESIVEGLAGAFSRLFKNTFNMTKLERIKAALTKVLVECANCTTDKGILYWDGKDELAVDMPVFTDEAKETPAKDDEYIKEDGTTIVVKDGKVSEIKEKEAEPVDAPAPAPEVEADEEEKPEETSAPEEEEKPAEDTDGKGDLDKRVEALEQKVAKIIEWLGIVVIKEGEDGLAESFSAQMSAIKAELEALKKTPAAEDAHKAYNKMAAEDEPAKDRRCVSRRTL